MQDINQYIERNPIRAVERFDEVAHKLKYSSLITSDRKLDEITGDEERVRATVLTKLVNEYGYL